MSATLAARARPDARISVAPRRAATRRGPGLLARLARSFGRRPGRSAIVLLFGAVSVVIVANAILFQKVRHPAPMLAAPAPANQRPAERQAIAVEQPSAASAPAGVPAQQLVMPPARPGDLSSAPREAAPRPPAPVASAPSRQAQSSHAPARPAAQPAPARDPIADLINGADLRPPADIRSASSARAGQTRRSAEN
jgi:hypothetical protein